MDDRKLREYAFKIYSGDSDYSLQKAFRLFPKYYPKIAFFYTELLTKQQNEFSLRMIQGLGIDKGRALLNELNILNERISKFYVNAEFKLNQAYKRTEDAKDEYDRRNVLEKEQLVMWRIADQSNKFAKEANILLRKIYNEAKIYNFESLKNDIKNTKTMTKLIFIDLDYLNIRYLNYIQQYK